MERELEMKMNCIVAAISAMSVCLLSVSCTTAPKNVYIPRQLGSVAKADANPDADLEIKPSRMEIRHGDPIEFEVVLVNSSTNDYWVPKNLSPTFVWSFSDGRRDGQLPSPSIPREYDRQELALLKPGEKLSMTKTIKTNFFTRGGLVEFRAILQIPENTNPSIGPVFDGKLSSNGYGVMLAEEDAWRGDLDPSMPGDLL
jgi:hypothetical protein